MPVSNLAITVAISYADIDMADMLVPGLVIKNFVVIAAILSVNTIGEYTFQFSRFPDYGKAPRLRSNRSTSTPLYEDGAFPTSWLKVSI